MAESSESSGICNMPDSSESSSSSSTPPDQPPIAGGTCVNCSKWILKRKHEMACGNCDEWPVCLECSEAKHSGHWKKFNVMHAFNVCTDVYKNWWSTDGTEQYKSIISLHERVIDAISTFEHYFDKAPPELQDQEFYNYVMHARKNVRDRHAPFRAALEMLWRFQRHQELMHAYRTAACVPVHYSMAEMLFPNVIEPFQFVELRNKFKDLATEDNEYNHRQHLVKALDTLEDLNDQLRANDQMRAGNNTLQNGG